MVNSTISGEVEDIAKLDQANRGNFRRTGRRHPGLAGAATGIFRGPRFRFHMGRSGGAWRAVGPLSGEARGRQARRGGFGFGEVRRGFQ